ncbi:hypothetical protein ACQ4M3_23380 [Leptolyngbya sp. AN03gr2]|uniref:hypothetical protein n=1 Tax=unclassified Leptolyngbya TaxID=2650499 RepID=UPI003D322AE3
MIIADMDYVEEEVDASTLEGGRRYLRYRSNTRQRSLFSLFQPILQALNINPAASATVANIGGTSIGNTAISTNISMPIFIVINQFGDGSPQIFW